MDQHAPARARVAERFIVSPAVVKQRLRLATLRSRGSGCARGRLHLLQYPTISFDGQFLDVARVADGAVEAILLVRGRRRLGKAIPPAEVHDVRLDGVDLLLDLFDLPAENRRRFLRWERAQDG